MPFIKLHTFQQIRHHPDTVLYPLREGQRPTDKYLPEIYVESFAIATIISVVTCYQQYPEGYKPAWANSGSASHPHPSLQGRNLHRDHIQGTGWGWRPHLSG